MPSAAPTFVHESEVTSSSITVEWGEVECIHQNAEITGYSVQYSVKDSMTTESISVLGRTAIGTTITALKQSTIYLVRVAAVNAIGIGIYSDPTENRNTPK